MTISCANVNFIPKPILLISPPLTRPDPLRPYSTFHFFDHSSNRLIWGPRRHESFTWCRRLLPHARARPYLRPLSAVIIVVAYFSRRALCNGGPYSTSAPAPLGLINPFRLSGSGRERGARGGNAEELAFQANALCNCMDHVDEAFHRALIHMICSVLMMCKVG